MLDNIFWLLELVRDQILKKFIIPDLDISYWEFCIYGALVAVVVTVLVNAVKVSGSGSAYSSKENRYQETLRQRERVKADERQKIKNGSVNDSGHDWDAFERHLNSKD